MPLITYGLVSAPLANGHSLKQTYEIDHVLRISTLAIYFSAGEKGETLALLKLSHLKSAKVNIIRIISSASR